jgi:hypothetical protein
VTNHQFSMIACAILFTFGTIATNTQAQQPSKDLSSQEQTLCRSDAIRLCFFKISDADGLRSCLRSNKPNLSAGCRKLIETRGG